MKTQLAKLVDLKSIITLGMVTAMIYGFVIGRVPVELFAAFVSSVITYYFTRPASAAATPPVDGLGNPYADK